MSLSLSTKNASCVGVGYKGYKTGTKRNEMLAMTVFRIMKLLLLIMTLVDTWFWFWM
jgi:hypothetical protein